MADNLHVRVLHAAQDFPFVKYTLQADAGSGRGAAVLGRWVGGMAADG